MVQKTGVVPQLQFIEGCRHPFRAAEAVHHGPDYSADHRDSAVAVRFSVVDVPAVLVVQILRRSQRLPFFCRQAQMLGSRAGMAQKDSHTARLWPRSVSLRLVAGPSLGHDCHGRGRARRRHRQLHVQAGLLATMQFVLFPFDWRQAQRSWTHDGGFFGRSSTTMAVVRTVLVLLVRCTSCCVLFDWL